MRIAIISKGTWPKITGGAELVTDKVIRGLKKKGHKVFVISKKWSKKEMWGKSRPEMSDKIDFKWSREAVQKALALKPDVVYISQYLSEAAPMFIPKKFPVVMMIHDLGFLDALEKRKLSPAHFRQILNIWRKSIKNASKLIVASHLTKRQLIETFPQAKGKVIFIPLGVS